MTDETQHGVVLIIGCEPAAFAACLELTQRGLGVLHVYPTPLGLTGSPRDIGLAYPEPGEPFERLSHALGEEIAAEFYIWSRLGVLDIEQHFPDHLKRGSRLWVTRTESESKLAAADAVNRQNPPVNDECRLMSGAAASNYAPLDGAHQASFETHAIAFAPLQLLGEMKARLEARPHYRALEVAAGWDQLKVQRRGERIQATLGEEVLAEGDLALVAAGYDTGRILDRFEKILLPQPAQAFRSPPLKEKARSSVVGITASWGFERYRFDDEFRLLGCGINPTSSTETLGEGVVDEETMRGLLARAAQLFTDFDGSTEQLMQWAVQFAVTCDGLPLLGPLPGEPAIHVATGFSFSAWSRGWQAGRVLAQAIANPDNAPNTGLLGRCSTLRFLPRREA